MVSRPAEDPSSSWDHDFVENVEDAGDVEDAVDAVALVVDVDGDYVVADFDSAAEQGLDVSCTGTRIGLTLV